MMLHRFAVLVLLLIAASAEFLAEKDWLAQNSGKTSEDYKVELEAFNKKLAKENAIEAENKAFSDADLDKDGKHSEEEIIKDIMKQGGFELRDDGTYLEQGVKEAFIRADANDDGKVDLAEYMKAFEGKTEEDFKSSDPNGDGFHDKEEQLNHVSEGQKKLLEEAHKSAKHYIETGDKNGDGMLTQEEKKHSVRKHMLKTAFNDGDENDDGKHSKDEVVAVVMKQKNFLKLANGNYVEANVEGAFKYADKDGNGEVTLSEYLKAFPDKKESDFKLSDANGDGIHTLEEQTNHKSEAVVHALKESTEQAHEIVKNGDKDGDGHLDMVEFDQLLAKDEL